MGSKKITYISVSSVSKIVPLIYLILFFIIALVVSLYLSFTTSLTMIDLFLGSILYALFGCTVFSIITFLIVFLYNILAEKIGFIEIDYKDNDEI